MPRRRRRRRRRRRAVVSVRKRSRAFSKVGLHLILVFIWPCDYDHHENPLRNVSSYSLESSLKED